MFIEAVEKPPLPFVHFHGKIMLYFWTSDRKISSSITPICSEEKKEHSQKDLFELNKKCQSAYPRRPITQIYFRIRHSSVYSVFPMPILEPSSQYIFRHKPLPFFIFFTTYIVPFYQQCTVVHVYNNI